MDEKYEPIDINTLSAPAPKISSEALKAIAEFEAAQEEKTFSQRHPELGKMFNCRVCGTRHRPPHCEQRFAKVRIGHKELQKLAKKHHLLIPDQIRQTEPMEPKRRYGMGSNKRINPHWANKRLQLVQLTRDLISYFDGEDAVKKARSRAMNLLRKKWNEPFAFKTKRFGKKIEDTNAVSEVVSES